MEDVERLAAQTMPEQGLSNVNEVNSPEGRNVPDGRSAPYVIAIANQKGGVAKTTTVVSLGGALVNHQKDVLLVDLDAQANLTLALGKEPSRVRGVISQVFFNAASLSSISRETAVPGLDLIASNAEMDTAERFLPLRKNHETLLRQAIRGGESGAILPYDFVILDCPPFIGAVTMNAIIAADMLIIPTQPEYFSAHALRTMMMTIKQVRSQFNADLVYRILITMFDRRNRIHRQVEEQIRKTFTSAVLNSMIEIDTKLRESAVDGVPVTHHPAAARAHPPRSVLQYENLAQELINYVSSR